MDSLEIARDLHAQVPTNWYEKSVAENIFQRYWHKCRINEITKLDLSRIDKVLDVGCADGYLAAQIFCHIRPNKYVGVDAIPGFVTYAQARYKKLAPKLQFIIADGHRLPFFSQQFSHVYCIEMLEHVPNPTHVLREVRRVLKKGGELIVLVPAESLLFRLVWFFWTRLKGKVWHETHLQHFNSRTLDNLLIKERFVIVKRKVFLLGCLLLIQAKKN